MGQIRLLNPHLGNGFQPGAMLTSQRSCRDDCRAVCVDCLHAVDNGQLVGDFRVQREVLAEADAGNVGADRPELAADFGRRFWFHVVHVQVARPAGQIDEDDRPPGLRRDERGHCAGRQQSRQCQPADGCGGMLKKLAPSCAVDATASGRYTGATRHGGFSTRFRAVAPYSEI
jgi:hypothetical protein